MKFEKLKPGMVVYDVKRQKMGNTNVRTVSVFKVVIESIDVEKRTCMARWNVLNPARRYSAREAEKWREKPPVLITSAFGAQRIATRAEVAALAAEKE